ncbi:hypothetical protein [Bdellovibrio svalbardensis]|uniref:Lipoprotein SmpA/OmlA domain-containing protein n=1 Tax=Bdellovibrio svalbardensis TaxID=2972972 RepID=A0ABT6DFG4_9BACT|nr:hypothetical protein [Bdellovibrio svalbardensis]MDG0815571.1 hypothetical protein [Bdellovibrio svalbardensis]
MRFSLLLALLFSFSICHGVAAPTKNSSAAALKELILPASLQKVLFGKTTQDEILKSLGKPKQKSSNKSVEILYYNLTGKDFDTTVAFKNKKLLYIVYSPSSPQVTFKHLGQWITTEDLMKVAKTMSAKVSNEKGREIQIEKRNLGTSFIFTDNRDMTLKSVTVWKEGEAAP